MRYLYLIFMIIVSSVVVSAQNITITLKANKATQIIFPGKIKSYKPGFIPEDFVLDQSENILYIQPIFEFSEETNLHVITKSGLYYAIALKYDSSTKIFNHILKENQAFYKENRDTTIVDVSAIENNKKNESNICKEILNQEGFIVSRNAKRFGKFWLILKGVYVTDDKMYFRILVENKGNIQFDIDYMTFYVQQGGKKKNITKESVQYLPSYIYNDAKFIKANEKNEFVFEFDKFTISNDKAFFVDIIEKGGERNLSLPIRNDKILQAKKID